MKPNDKYLIKLWKPAIIIGLLAIYSIFASGNFGIILIPVVVAIVFMVLKIRSKNGVAKALQHEDPSRLIDTIVKPLKSSISQKKTAECLMAYNTAISHVLYGEYKQAEDVMSRVDWASKEPMFQSLDWSIKSLIHLFTGNIHLGLSEARQARALATTSAFPGAQKSIDTYEAYIQVGQILAGICHDEMIHSLEAKQQKLPLIPALLIAWGLINGYHERNELEKYRRMVEFCENNAPHCHPLRRLVSVNGD
ncbi:hypothetical protein [Paenibacillus sp. TH7-28]